MEILNRMRMMTHSNFDFLKKKRRSMRFYAVLRVREYHEH